MRNFDAERFAQSLAGALLAGKWAVAALSAATSRAAADLADGAGPAGRVPGLAGRLVARFPGRPRFGELLAALAADAGFLRAIDRASGRMGDPPAPQRVKVRRAEPMDAPPAGLAVARRPPITTVDALADWLGVSVGRLRWLADVAGRNRLHPPGPLRTYRYRWIAKAGGGGAGGGGNGGRARLLEIPTGLLRRAQRRVLDDILSAVPPHPAAHGFCRGRSIVTNAAEHCGRAVVMRFDLADFFPSVPAARTLRVFRTLGYPRPIARLLAGLCTTRLPADVWAGRPRPDPRDFAAWQRLSGRHLPQGAPSSPALANLAAHRLDRRLSGLAAAAGATYTRYADDLTFSGGDDLRRAARRLASRVAAIAADEGFAVRPDKTRVMGRSQRQHVAGVVVNVRPNVPRDEYDRLKAVLSNCVRHGPASQNRAGVSDFRAHLAGRVGQVAAVSQARGAKLRVLLAKVAWESRTASGPSGTPPSSPSLA